MLLGLFLYLSLYTWNLRTGVLDTFVTNTGLEFVGWTLIPGKWVSTQTVAFWERYVYLTGVRRENEELSKRLSSMALDLARYREEAREVERLRRLLSFTPPDRWNASGVRIVTHKLGPNAALETLIVDKGRLHGATRNTPVVTSRGVMGRILRAGPSISTVLLLTDPNSSIAVISQKHRTSAILTGRGADTPLHVYYVDRNAPLEPGELLITSGLAGIFPKGLPVARILSAERSDISLFQNVTAEPLAELQHAEEALLLTPVPFGPPKNIQESPLPPAPQEHAGTPAS